MINTCHTEILANLLLIKMVFFSQTLVSKQVFYGICVKYNGIRTFFSSSRNSISIYQSLYATIIFDNINFFIVFDTVVRFIDIILDFVQPVYS